MSPMTRPVPVSSLTALEERVYNIDARLDVLVAGVHEILSDLQRIKARFGIGE